MPSRDDDTSETDEFDDVTEAEIRAAFDEQSYVADDEIVTTVLLALRLGRPLLIEGEPGAGKTELAKVLAGGFDAELVRLQCYEGLAAENALYEWNYTKQLLAVQAGEGGVAEGATSDTDDESVFSEPFLLERPLLQALRGEGRRVLLVDEVDRADEAFEALLLEVLSDFQVSVPELGTIAASTPPVVVVTSNRTRPLSDALKRRCLYLHVTPPSFEKEREILARKVPELHDAVAAELCGVVRRLREEPLRKPPGAAETIDWARAVATLRENGSEGTLSHAEVRRTLGAVLKEVEDVERVDDDLLDSLVEAARAAREAAES